jgi:hypothetical protein
MKSVLGITLSALVLSPALLAQTAPTPEPLGTTASVNVSATSRGSNGGSAGAMLNRMEYDQYRAWGQDGSPKSLAFRTIHGFKANLQDQDASTQQKLDWVGYSEDSSNANFPDPAGLIFTSSQAWPFTATSGITSATIVSIFKTPVQVPAKGDVFVGLETDAVAGAGWPTDGVSVNITLGYQPTSSFTVFDLGGPALGTTGPRNTYGYSWIMPAASNPPLANGPRQYLIDPLVLGGTGAATAVTNQTSFTSSNAAPGTTSFLSALNPDIKDPPLNATRADDIGYLVEHTLAAGNPVVFALAAKFAPFDIPLGAGSGVLSLDLGTFFIAGAAVGSAAPANQASIVYALPAAFRKDKNIAQIAQQAFIFANNSIIACPATVQNF